MDPVSALAIAPADRDRPRRPDPDLLPSRRLARDTIRGALARGPVALTGEPGVGKTELWRGLEAMRAPGETWLAVEATPGLGPGGLYRRIARELRVEPAGFEGPELRDFLAARSLDSERWTLAIDEAQNLDADALEEVRVLSNRLGRPDGFAAILIVGQTPLARRLMSRPGFALASRLSVHVHLRPLDAEEVGRLLDDVAPGRDWPEEAVDRIHQATGGRPGLVVDRATRAEPRPAPATPARDAPLVGPAKPPIRVEDGLIEVGWSPEPEPPPVDESERPGAGPEEYARTSGAPDAAEERIDDHYAALQAWHEWATNQGRHPEIVAAESAPAPPPRRDPAPVAPKVWADEEHGFAPFGRLFTSPAHGDGAD